MTRMEATKFVKKLKSGEVHFQYTKSDGSLRTARGTMKRGKIPAKKKAKLSKRRKYLPSDSIFYYDLGKKGFRSFKMSRFEGYIEDTQKKEDKQSKKMNESQIASEDIEAFKQQLYHGKVSFKYINEDGVLVEAIGTMCPDLLPLPPVSRHYDLLKLQNKRLPNHNMKSLKSTF